jgi:3'-5' exoribonuclease
MSRRNVEQLRDGDPLDDVYLAADKQLRVNRKGDPFIQMDLRDRTGGISARLWNAGEALFRSFENGDFVHAEGKVQNFQGTLQVILEHFAFVEPQKVEVADFLPKTDHDIPEMTAKLRGLLGSLADANLRALGTLFLNDGDFLKRFQTCPAGIKLHHAYVGGLLEHTVTMMEIAEKLLPFYPGTDRDLTLIGLFLHDIGKTRELSYARAFGYTDEGQLLGHVVIGAEMLTEKASQLPGFPRDLLVKVKHLVLSHHGTLEHGSPKVPMTAEAVLLHSIDLMDTRMHMVARDYHEDRNNATAWTPYNANLQRRFYKGGANGDLFTTHSDSFD